VIAHSLLADALFRLVLVRLLLHLLAPLHQRIIIILLLLDRDLNLLSFPLILCRVNCLLKNSLRLKTDTILDIDESADVRTIIGVLVLMVLTLARLLTYRLVSIRMANACLSGAKILLRTQCRI
jgi:hypothetical protein